MDSNRFDRFTALLGRRQTRRQALAGAAGIALFGGVSGASALAAQDATPAATPVAAGSSPTFLFVQMADSGSWAPKPGEDGVYLLTLRGTGEQTLYFSDRPERIVGTMPTDQFLDTLGFTPVNPPNAAVVVTTPDGVRDVLVIELMNPVYARSFGEDGEEVLIYEAIVLGGYQGAGLAEWTPQVDDDNLPQNFADISLFIDDCPDAEGCYVDKRDPGSDGPFHSVYVGPIPGGPYGRCFNWYSSRCQHCPDQAVGYFDTLALCNAAYPGEDQCWDSCYTDTCRLGGTC